MLPPPQNITQAEITISVILLPGNRRYDIRSPVTTTIFLLLSSKISFGGSINLETAKIRDVYGGGSFFAFFKQL
jgi:hypothetical protein